MDERIAQPTQAYDSVNKKEVAVHLHNQHFTQQGEVLFVYVPMLSINFGMIKISVKTPT